MEGKENQEAEEEEESPQQIRMDNLRKVTMLVVRIAAYNAEYAIRLGSPEAHVRNTKIILKRVQEFARDTFCDEMEEYIRDRLRHFIMLNRLHAQYGLRWAKDKYEVKDVKGERILRQVEALHRIVF